MSDSNVFANPLRRVHEQAEAEFQPYAQLPIVSTFGEPQAEYAAIRKSCGMMDQPQRGFLELTGADRLTFLNNLLTNQTFDKQTKTGIASGAAPYAFLLSAKTGRIIVDVRVLELGERTLLELDARFVESVRVQFDRYLFGEKVSITIPTNHQIALHGPRAAEWLNASIDSSIDLAPSHCCAVRMNGHDGVAWRDDPCGVPGIHLIVPRDAARAIWMHFITKFSADRSLRAVGWAAFNATRIEAGTPLFGIDFDDQTLPAETGPLLDRAVSFTKGCYPGQEVVARMHARGQVARKIVGFRMIDGDALPLAGAQVFESTGANQIGIVTSSTLSPVLSNAAIGLAMVKKSAFAIDTLVKIPAEGAMRDAAIQAVPFIKPA